MANSYVEYTGDGATTNRAVPFGYIDQDHVTVTVDGVSTSFTWVNASTISISPAPANGTAIRISRSSSPNTRLVDYQVGTLTEEDLDTDSKQAFYLCQEAVDAANDALLEVSNEWDAENQRITNVADAVDAQDAVTKAQLDAAVLDASGYTPTATSITVTPTGGISSTNVQAALAELDSEKATTAALAAKADLASPALTGNPTAPTQTQGNNSTRLATTAYVDTAVAAVPTSVLPLSLQDGCVLSNNGSDATNDIDISAGLWSSDDALAADRVQMLATALTKQLDAAWAVGTNQGMRDTGAISNGTWHIFLIKRVDTGVVDVLASTSASSPTMPANYTKKRRIGSILRESGAIVAFVQDGDDFYRKTPASDVYTNPTSTSAVTRTLSVPDGLRVKAHLSAVIYGNDVITGGPAYVYISDLSTNDTAAGATLAFGGAGGASDGAGSYLQVWTNTSRQIRSRMSNADADGYLGISTLGWADPRGRNA